MREYISYSGNECTSEIYTYCLNRTGKIESAQAIGTFYMESDIVLMLVNKMFSGHGNTSPVNHLKYNSGITSAINKKGGKLRCY